jgi:ABC-2 type transport system permease protein
VIGAFLSQWVRLRRRTVLLATFGGSAGFALLATVVTFTSAEDRPVRPRHDVPSAAELARPDGVVAALADATEFLGVLALAVAAWAIGSEYSHGTLRNLLVRQPRRLTLLAGSVLAVLSLVALAALLACAAAVAAAYAAAPDRGIDTGAWSPVEVAAAAGNTALAMAGFALLGVALGVGLRSPAAAIGVGVAYVLPVEQILLSGAVDGAERWLPGQLLDALADGGTEMVGYDRAAAILALYLTATAIACALLFKRRDVTA